MDSIDLIIVVIFLIIVVYVIQRAISTVEQQADTEFQKKELEQQLKEQTLGDKPLSEIFDISFRIDPSRNQFSYSDGDKDKQPKSLFMTVINKSQTVTIYVDWDKSTISNYSNPSRRVIRLRMDEKLGATSLPPGSQVPSPVAPGTTMTARITVEDILEVKSDEKTSEKFSQPKEPLLSFTALQKDVKNKKLPKPVQDARKKQKNDFDDRKTPLEFSLRLMLRLVDMNQGSTFEYQYLLKCRFTVTRVRWANLLPWMPKK